MAKKPFDPKKYWASRIVRVISPSGEKVCGLVFRRYSETDVERVGLGTWIGMEEVPEYPMRLDTDEDSDTFGKRIEDTTAEPINIKTKFFDEWNKANIEKYQAMVGETVLGNTELIFRIGAKAYDAETPDEFWTATKKEIQDKYQSKVKTVIIREEKKSK